MSEWDANQYVLFERQRTQPAVDLVMHVKKFNPKTIIDIGCGPGNSTEILYNFYPKSEIIGIDRSSNMIEKAKTRYPDLQFRTCSVDELDGMYDFIFSNACLQWVPNHQFLIPMLMNKLNKDGVLAVQIPYNGTEPLYEIVSEVKHEPKWGFHHIEIETNETLQPKEYIDILSGCSSCFEIWETKYYHILPNYQALIDWIKGTTIRPYLLHLDPEKGLAFEKEILERATKVYPKMDNGTIIFGFRRLFFTAIK